MRIRHEMTLLQHADDFAHRAVRVLAVGDERLFCRFVLNEFDGGKEPDITDISDRKMVFLKVLEDLAEKLAGYRDLVKDAGLGIVGARSDAGRAGHRMAAVGKSAG